MTRFVAPLDTLGMFSAAAGMPEQIEEAARVAAEVTDLPEPDGIASVLVLGMGGSGMAGDLLAATAGPFLPVPVVVSKGYTPPSFVDESTLVFAISFSGNTEETLSATEMAVGAGARIVAIAAGGELAHLASHWHAPVIPIDASIPMPRAGLGAVAIPPMVVLERLGLFTGATEYVGRAVDQLRSRRDQLVLDGNPAQEMARRIGRSVPVIYGGGEIGAVAALRWKCQFNENAELAAFTNQVPEMCHNEICGWGRDGDSTGQVFTLVELRHDHEHPQVMRRFDIISELLDDRMAVETVTAAGDGELAQLLDLVLFGDFVSLHAAVDAGLDPGPVPVLDDIKAALRP